MRIAPQTDQSVPVDAEIKGWHFAPYPRLRDGHLQTIAGALWRRTYRPEVLRAEERLIEVEPGTRVLARCSWLPDRRTRPTLFLVHGLEGADESCYMLGTASRAIEAGFNAIRYNIRNCGGTEHLSPTLYNSGMSGDVARALEHVVEAEGLDRVVVVGFSLGGNQVLKMAGEYGAAPPSALRGVAAVSPAIDLAASSAYLERRSNWIYRRRFVRSLAERMRRKHALYPGRFDVSLLKGMKTLRDYDNRYIAPHFGFRDAEDYYERASSLPLIPSISVPTLVLHAEDDPFVPLTDRAERAARSNPNVHVIHTRHGGHVGFVSAHARDRHWAENRAVDFAAMVF